VTRLIRVLAILIAAAWAVLGFALADLAVLLLWNPWFVGVFPLEASWGALLMFFVVVPCIHVAIRPDRWADLLVTGGIALASIVAGSVLAGDPATLILAGALAVCLAGIAVPGVIRSRSGAGDAGPPWHPRLDLPLLVLAVAGAVLWAPYLVNATAGSDSLPRDITLGLDHWPVHIAAGIAIPLGALVAAVLGRLRTLAACASALSSVSIGTAMAVSQGAPSATESAHWSVLSITWGTAVLLALVWSVLRREHEEEEILDRVDREGSRSTS
jgi:hypothetical protein